MRPGVFRFVTALILVSCGAPVALEPWCACPPSRSAVAVKGWVESAGGGPAVGATLVAEQIGVVSPGECDVGGPLRWKAEGRSGSGGEFLFILYTGDTPGPGCLRLLASGPDGGTALLEPLQVEFRLEGQVLDTLVTRFTLIEPPEHPAAR